MKYIKHMKQTLNTTTKTLLYASCLAGIILSPALRAQNLTTDELEKAVSYLEKTRAGVVEATKGLTAEQWNFKPATNRWSVAEVTEHIAAAEDLLMGMIQSQVMTAPARTEPEDVKAIDGFILKQIPDRTHKAQAPDALQPTNRFGSPAASLKHFQDSRAKTIEFVKATQDLRQHAYTSPQLGKKLDGYEWVLFIAAHSERHMKQIDEVKADPNYPKK
jgi:uncharacterized damage-inducible protein DinB